MDQFVFINGMLFQNRNGSTQAQYHIETLFQNRIRSEHAFIPQIGIDKPVCVDQCYTILKQELQVHKFSLFRTNSKQSIYFSLKQKFKQARIYPTCKQISLYLSATLFQNRQWSTQVQYHIKTVSLFVLKLKFQAGKHLSHKQANKFGFINGKLFQNRYKSAQIQYHI